MREVAIEQIVRWCIYIAVLNLTVSVAITVPVIVPEFTFPLILTIWPGTWILIAYFVFLIVAVLGFLGWALLLGLMRKYFGRVALNKYLTITHLSLTLFGVYGETSLMFTVGYLGGYAALVGIGRAVITQQIIGWMVVPIGIFIYLYLLGTIAGIASLFFARRLG